MKNSFVFKLFLYSLSSTLLWSLNFKSMTSQTLRNWQPSFHLMFLESNTWLWNINGITILVDPVMVGALDFGIPSLYSGTKTTVDGCKVLQEILPKVDYVLISQGFEDHAHSPTLKRMSQLRSDMSYIAPPSAKSILQSCGIREQSISTIVPGEKRILKKGSNNAVEITATSGALLGPPWQSPENGYIVRSTSISTQSSVQSLYYEPHCMYDPTELSNYSVDCVITPVVAQELPFYTLVAGGSKALALAELLKATVLVPMNNGELNQSGVLSSIVRKGGTVESFKRQVEAARSKIRVVDAPAGVEICL